MWHSLAMPLCVALPCVKVRYALHLDTLRFYFFVYCLLPFVCRSASLLVTLLSEIQTNVLQKTTLINNSFTINICFFKKVLTFSQKCVTVDLTNGTALP